MFIIIFLWGGGGVWLGGVLCYCSKLKDLNLPFFLFFQKREKKRKRNLSHLNCLFYKENRMLVSVYFSLFLLKMFAANLSHKSYVYYKLLYLFLQAELRMEEVKNVIVHNLSVRYA